MIVFIYICIGLTLAIGVLGYFSFYYGKRLFFPRICNKEVQGEVIKYTFANYGTGGANVRWPITTYKVGEKSYQVTGPKYKGVVVFKKSKPSNKIVTDQTYWISKRGWVHVNVNMNSFIHISNNIMADMYPVGTKVTVYYNPKKPKEAFVEKIYTSKLLFFTFAIYFIFMIGLAIWLIPTAWANLL